MRVAYGRGSDSSGGTAICYVLPALADYVIGALNGDSRREKGDK